jgi:hypothetical protein
MFGRTSLAGASLPVGAGLGLALGDPGAAWGRSRTDSAELRPGYRAA